MFCSQRVTTKDENRMDNARQELQGEEREKKNDGKNQTTIVQKGEWHEVSQRQRLFFDKKKIKIFVSLTCACWKLNRAFFSGF